MQVWGALREEYNLKEGQKETPKESTQTIPQDREKTARRKNGEYMRERRCI